MVAMLDQSHIIVTALKPLRGVALGNNQVATVIILGVYQMRVMLIAQVVAEMVPNM